MGKSAKRIFIKARMTDTLEKANADLDYFQFQFTQLEEANLHKDDRKSWVCLNQNLLSNTSPLMIVVRMVKIRCRFSLAQIQMQNPMKYQKLLREAKCRA